RVRLPRPTRRPVLDQGMEASGGKGGHRARLSLARPAAHLGVLARPERHAAAGADGAGRVGELRDGASVRAFGGRSPAGRGQPHRWHVFDTKTKAATRAALVST